MLIKTDFNNVDHKKYLGSSDFDMSHQNGKKNLTSTIFQSFSNLEVNWRFGNQSMKKKLVMRAKLTRYRQIEQNH